MSKPIRHGVRRWRIRPLNEHGERESAVFDDYREAMRALRARELEVDEIRRGLRAPTPPAKTFGDLCDYWIENRVPQKRSGDDDKYIIAGHLRPSFGPLSLGALGMLHFDRYTVERRHLAPQTVKNHLTLLTSMLNQAVDLGWLRVRPKIKKPRVPSLSDSYRWLKHEERDRLLSAAERHGALAHAFYATAVFTGMRAGELCGLRSEDIDLARRLITVRRSFYGPTKNGESRHVPILDPLLPILRAWQLRCPGEIVFPNAAGNMHDPCARLMQETFHRVLDAAGLQRYVDERGRSRPFVRFHDLRHTFASHWILGCGEIVKLRKILGHKSLQMTLRYAHLAPDAFASDYGVLAPPRAQSGT